MFSRSGALFLSYSIGEMDASECDVNYSILPIPKLNRYQDQYFTGVDTEYTFYGISWASINKTLSAQVLQTLGYYGYKYTTPVIFEKTLGAQRVKDASTVQMLKIIRESIALDNGFICDRVSTTMLPNLVSRSIYDQTNWNTAMTSSRKKIYNNSIDELNKKILNYFNELMS